MRPAPSSALCLPRCGRSIVRALLALLAFAQLPAVAQMQIPNPLIRPRSLTNPGAREPAPADNAQQRPGAGNTPPAAVPLNGAPASNTPEDIYTRSLNELKDRFATFYVSAIVGKDAILRRSAGGARAALPSTSLSSGGANAVPAAIPISGSTASATPTRSDTLMVSDGELLDSVGNSGALVAKVGSRQVTIYYIQETMSLPGGKLIGKRAVVFAGDVENSGTSGAPVIVLERSDPAYTAKISVQSRIRSASGNSQDSGSSNASGSNANGTPSTQAPQ